MVNASRDVDMRVHERARQAMEGFALIALAIAAVLIGFFLIRQSKKKGPWGASGR